MKALAKRHLGASAIRLAGRWKAGGPTLRKGSIHTSAWWFFFFFGKVCPYLWIFEKMDLDLRILSVNYAQDELGLAPPWSNGTDVVVDFSHQHNQIPPLHANSTEILSGPPPTKADKYTFGSHTLWDGVRFLAFSILTLLCVAIILTVGGFFVVGLVLFPMAEIPTGFVRSKRHWHHFWAFFGLLFNKVFKFVNGLWDWCRI